jgi:hypothetical protein
MAELDLHAHHERAIAHATTLLRREPFHTFRPLLASQSAG